VTQRSPGTAQDSTGTEPLLDALSHVNFSELLIGPCLLEHWLTSDGKAEVLSFRCLTAALTFAVEPGTLPEPLAKLLTTVSQVPLNGES